MFACTCEFQRLGNKGVGDEQEGQDFTMNQGKTVVSGSDEPALLTTQEAAKFLHVSERTLWTITESGRIPRIKVRRCVRYKIEDLVRYIDLLRADGMNKKKGAA